MQLNKSALTHRLIRSIPYLLIALLTTKLSLAWRVSSGSDFSAHIMSFLSMLGTAFRSPRPSLYPADLIFGAVCGGLLRLTVYLKGHFHTVRFPRTSSRWLFTPTGTQVTSVT